MLFRNLEKCKESYDMICTGELKHAVLSRHVAMPCRHAMLPCHVAMSSRRVMPQVMLSCHVTMSYFMLCDMSCRHVVPSCHDIMSGCHDSMFCFHAMLSVMSNSCYANVMSCHVEMFKEKAVCIKIYLL